MGGARCLRALLNTASLAAADGTMLNHLAKQTPEFAYVPIHLVSGVDSTETLVRPLSDRFLTLQFDNRRNLYQTTLRQSHRCSMTKLERLKTSSSGNVLKDDAIKLLLNRSEPTPSEVLESITPKPYNTKKAAHIHLPLQRCESPALRSSSRRLLVYSNHFLRPILTRPDSTSTSSRSKTAILTRLRKTTHSTSTPSSEVLAANLGRTMRSPTILAQLSKPKGSRPKTASKITGPGKMCRWTPGLGQNVKPNQKVFSGPPNTRECIHTNPFLGVFRRQ